LGDSSRSALILGDYGQADAAPQCPDNAFCWGVFLADNGHQSADLISAIQTRQGAGIEMTYKPSYQYPGNHFPLTVETLETLSINEWAAFDAPTTPSTVYTFSYANGLYNSALKEFMGFHEVVEINPDQSVKTTWHHQSEYLKGKAYAMRFQSAAGDDYVEETFNWGETPISSSQSR
ncbi:MAG: hypothetical protein GY859_16395, partial [Desulfobacterales bacterium]|nr:hypothetical protein [Desulfobacterales bacterium]